MLISLRGGVSSEQSTSYVKTSWAIKLVKRIANVCLFMVGMFPQYAQPSYPYNLSAQAGLEIGGRRRRSASDYEDEGKRFYKQAADSPWARDLELSDVFWLLHENFAIAMKPLNFISEHYLHLAKHRLFGI